MPKAFDRCRSGGGKIRTVSMSSKKYKHVCILNGKTVSGEVKKKKITKR